MKTQYVGHDIYSNCTTHNKIVQTTKTKQFQRKQKVPAAKRYTLDVLSAVYG